MFEFPYIFGHVVSNISYTLMERKCIHLYTKSCNSVFGQRYADRRLPSLHLLLRSGHLLLSAAVLQEHGGQVAQAGALREGEAQHALQDGRVSDLRA